MEAIVITKPGGPDVLELQSVPDPVMGPDEVLIEVAAAGVNRADLLQRQGMYPPPEGASPYPGLECSGRIIKVGKSVARLAVGAEVCALLPGGGYASRVAVHRSLVLRVPSGVSLVDAAGIMEAACTVVSNLHDIACLTSSDTLLLHGAAGGIGTFASQYARALGVDTIFGTTRVANFDAISKLGVTHPIDYRNDDFVEVVKRNGGVDVVLDNMGASYLEQNVSVLKRDGRLVTIGMQGGRKGTLDFGKLLSKNASVHASGLRGRPLSERAAIVDNVESLIWPLIASGKIRPVISRRIGLSEAAVAHQFLDEGGHVGKALLVV